MSVYIINLEITGRTSVTVSDYLRNERLRPPFPNPETRIRELIRGHGLVHYTRSGTRTVIADASFVMHPGEFLVVADSCSTGSECTVSISLTRKDHALVMPDDIEDPFALEAENFYALRPNTNLISGRVSTLDRLVRTIYSDDQINSPINDIFIVTHASENGFYFPKDSHDTDTFVDYDELCDYIDSGSRPVINSRIIQNNAHVYIKGCKIGEDTRYLAKLRELFGNQITVSAPKHIDSYGHREDTTTDRGEVIDQTIHNYECMKYCFTVFSKNRLGNKNAVIRLFLDKHFTDIYGTEITRAKYLRWIPNSVNTSSRSRYRCDIPIRVATVELDFKHRLRTVFVATLEYDDATQVPSGASRRLTELRTDLSRNELMQTSHPYPYYERWGYSNFESFWNGLNWSTPSWDSASSELSSQGTRHEYELRIPITGPNSEGNRLMLNAFLDPGRGPAAAYLHHDIVETDSRFFGTVP